MILLYIFLSIIALAIVLFIFCACKVASICDDEMERYFNEEN